MRQIAVSVVKVVFNFCELLDVHEDGRRMRFLIMAVAVGVSCLGGLWYRGYHSGNLVSRELWIRGYSRAGGTLHSRSYVVS